MNELLKRLEEAAGKATLAKKNAEHLNNAVKLAERELSNLCP